VIAVSGTSPLGAFISLLLAVLAHLSGLGSPPSQPASSGTPQAGVSVASAPRRAPFAVGIRTITFVDTTRTVRYPGQPPGPRKLVTVIRYPAAGPASNTDVPGAPPARSAGPFPLVIFGHGFAVTPGPYAPLLQAWARAGYVVAAPIFPLENANAPGGPNEADLINQPRDMSFVITRMLALDGARTGPFSRLVAPREIAVSGQSDGGETALAVAYDRYYLDRRVSAAVILSGAEIPGVGGFVFPAPSPPLLATQGTADTINPPSFTYTFFDIAPRPRFLLTLLGAPHLPPYTGEQPQLSIVERVTVAFLDRYLKHGRRGLSRMVAAGNVPGVAAFQSDP
jgi:predicted dienelactone hydrolase